jgi:Putative Ig domain
MKGSKPFPLTGLGLILCALLMLSACGGKTPSNGPSSLNILTTSPLPTGAEGDAYQQGLVASGGVQPYTWTVDSGALPPGLTLSTGGVLSGTPPAGSAGSYSFTLRVTDSQTPTHAYQTANMALTINPPLTFQPTTLVNGVVSVSYSSAVAAMGGIDCVPPQMTACYTYAIVSGSLPPGLTLDTNGTTTGTAGTISGTPTQIGTYSFTVQVTDEFPTTATALFSITVTGKIQGNYVFSFNGYNQQGQAFYMAGSFIADGNGDITSGVFDRNGNDSIGAMTNVAMTAGAGGTGICPSSGPPSGTGSVYCVGRPAIMGTSGANLGTIVIASALGTYSFSVSVSLVSDSRIILADPNNPGVWGSGVLKTQSSPSGVSLASGSFGFGLYGIDSGGNRYGGAGYFITDGSGNISSGNGEADINDNGSWSGQATPLTGSISATVDPITGRGTASFVIGSTTLDYAFYVIPAAPGKLVFPALVAVQTDPISSSEPVTLASITDRGAAGLGTTTFTNNNLRSIRGGSPNGSAFELNAVSGSGGTAAPDISLGLGNFDGNGNITSYIFDEDKGGTWTTPAQNSFTGTYSVDSSNKLSGRVTVNLTGVANNPVWYLTSSNTGFVAGTDPDVTVGSFEPQTAPSSGFSILSLFGNFYGGTSDPVLPSVINEVEAALAAPPPPPGTGNGVFTATYDSNGTTGVMMNQMFSGGYCLADGSPCPSTQQAQSATGRLLIVDGSGNPVDVLYIISAGAAGATNANTKSVTMGTGAQPSLSVLVH